jgi:hypothetical protein
VSKLEIFLADLLAELWLLITTPSFALWEILVLTFLVAKRLPWWIGAPVCIVWMFLRQVRGEK